MKGLAYAVLFAAFTALVTLAIVGLHESRVRPSAGSVGR